MIKISNCPITGLERNITGKNLFFNEVSKQVILECFISFFKDGNLINLDGIRSYKVSLVADNTFPVNKNTGEYLENIPEVWADENTIGQFDFFQILQNIPIVQADLILSHIQRADNNKRFDV